jgi:hypothetical protein
LAGINSVAVEVTVDESLAAAGIRKDRIQTDVELKLRRIGILIVDREHPAALDPEHPRLPIVLDIRVSGLWIADDKTQLAFRHDVFAGRVVSPLDAKCIAGYAIVWGGGANVGFVGQSRLSFIEENISKDVDKFLNDWLAANPPKP